MRRYAHELFGALAVLDPSLAIVSVGAPAGVAMPTGIEGAPGASSLPTNLGWMLTGLPRAARRAQLDLFHAPSYTAPVGGPRPLVLTIHDISYERNPEWYPYKRDPVRRAFYRYSARSADRVITDSQFSKREIVDVYALRPDTIDVVPLAAAPGFGDGPALPLPSGWPSQFVLHVGDLHVRRNLPMLARAVAAAAHASSRRGPDSAWCCWVSIAGPGAELERLSATARRTAPLVTFAGAAPEPLLLALYRSATRARLPVAVRGIRPSAARSDGLWDTCHRGPDVIDSGSGRRSSRAARSGRRRGRGSRRSPASSKMRPHRARLRAAGRAGHASSPGGAPRRRRPASTARLLENAS